MSHDLLSLGELLVDLVALEAGSLSGPGDVLFSRAAGGAPANVAAGAARLLGSHGRVGFVGRVGDDSFGHFLRATLDSFGVDTAYLNLSPQVQTPIAIAGRAAGSMEVEFSFYGPEDGKRLALITTADLPEQALAASRAVVIGGVSLSHPTSRAAIGRAAPVAAAGGALVAFDPNWRPALWSGPDAWRAAVLEVLPSVDVLKVGRGELSILSGSSDFIQGARFLVETASASRAPGKPLLVAVTMGAEGAAFALFSRPSDADEPNVGHAPGIKVNAVDPTGAGDAFLAALLVGLLEAAGRDGHVHLAALETEQIYRATLFANVNAALSTTKRGAMAGLPSRDEVEATAAAL